jgi:hypothetical protein
VFEEFIEGSVAHFAATAASGNTTAWHSRQTEDDIAFAAMD